jgi:hypothetical protein
MEISGKLRPIGKECIMYNRQEDGLGVQNSKSSGKWRRVDSA